eukprot:TRINITY_DN30887_c0_g1_i1.p1 TRINITY_DN30887_c0_g1~~TRINITY_DN30887_c0_g1_i1.p1  ORF type:complete len:916 (+),score=217.88 TRINITY_DN30887_c0_g1_i1:97-2844(+)
MVDSASAQSEASNLPAEPKICEPGGSGFVFPLTEAEQQWPDALRAALYTLALIYLFYGVNIIADKFMEAIEQITSRKRRVLLKGSGRYVTVKVWNETIANLTLLALGSSAPEILLSIIEIFGNDFYSGELGPSTIVGSAAFNLFIIVPVCILAIPPTEIRKIKELGVFFVTGVASIFAYVWLVVIIAWSSPDVVEVWEALLTLAFFPLLLLVSYAVDVGWPCGSRPPRMRFRLETGEESVVRADVSDAGAASGAGWRIAGPATGGAHADAFDQEVQHQRLRRQRTHRLVDEDGHPLVNPHGILAFESDRLQVAVGEESRHIAVPVFRKNGLMGAVGCSYRMESFTAVAGYDYQADEGKLRFEPGEAMQEIHLTLLPKRLGEHSDCLQIVLEDAEGGACFNPFGDGGAKRNVLTVTIGNERDHLAKKSCRLRFARCIDGLFNLDAVRACFRQWHEDILDATFEVGESGSSTLALALHVAGVPWKLLFALMIPPPSYGGGWVCFSMALGVIGCLTVAIIDFAELFGCVAQVQDSITAVTFVALGTSLPDLFASRIAALNDDTADAAIVNVTGSNCVNVFVGIGVPWTIGAFYWHAGGPNKVWQAKYPDFLAVHPQYASAGAFVVLGGQLAFSVIVFAVAAVICLAALVLRRVKVGGELGGNFVAQWTSVALFVSCWVYYIVLCIWQVETQCMDLLEQLVAVVVGLVVVENMTLLTGLCCATCGRGTGGKKASLNDEDLEVGSLHGGGGPPSFGAPEEADSELRRMAAACAADPRAGDLPAEGFLSCREDPKRSAAGASFISTAMVLLAASKMRRGAQAKRKPATRYHAEEFAWRQQVPYPTLLAAHASAHVAPPAAHAHAQAIGHPMEKAQVNRWKPATFGFSPHGSPRKARASASGGDAHGTAISRSSSFCSASDT